MKFLTAILTLGLILVSWFALAFPLTVGQTVNLTGQALIGSDTSGNAKIIITLVGAPCYTSTDLMPATSIVTFANAAGNWSEVIVGTDSISCVSGSTPTYTVEVQMKNGHKTIYGGLIIPANNGGARTLRSIIAAQ